MLEITLTTIYVGSQRRVVTLSMAGQNHAEEFLLAIEKSNNQGFRQLFTRMRTLSESKTYTNPQIFKSLGGKLYEIKTRSGLRLYAFLDTIDGIDEQLVIATCGGKKNTKKEQQKDISRAKQIMAQYIGAKDSDDTELTFNQLPDEN